MTSQPLMSRCLSSCVAVSAKQSTIITHTSVRAEDCSRSSAGAYRSRDNLPHAITVCVRQPRSERPECMKRARKRAGARKRQRALRSTKNLRPRYRMVARKFSCKISKKQLAAFNIDFFNKAAWQPYGMLCYCRMAQKLTNPYWSVNFSLVVRSSKDGLRMERLT